MTKKPKRAPSLNMKRTSRYSSERSASSQWSWTWLKNTAPADRRRQREILHRDRSAACSVRWGCKLSISREARSSSDPRQVICILMMLSLLRLSRTSKTHCLANGYRHVTHELHRRGHLVNQKRVARVMRANGLGSKPRKRHVRTSDSGHDSPINPNLYRNLIPPRPDMGNFG
jgi:hypothetical protein